MGPEHDRDDGRLDGLADALTGASGPGTSACLGERLDAAALGGDPHSDARVHGYVFPLHESRHTMPLCELSRTRVLLLDASGSGGAYIARISP